MSFPWFIVPSGQVLIDSLEVGEAFTYSIWTNERDYELAKPGLLAAGWIESDPEGSTVFLTKRHDVSEEEVAALFGADGRYVFEPIPSWVNAGRQ